MPTNFPTSVDNFTNPTANDSLNLPSHSTQHANANDAIEAVESYLLNGGQGLTLVKKQAIGSGVTSVTVTNAFSATYENYKIMISGGVGNPNDSQITLQLGSAATGYYWNLIYASYAGVINVVPGNNTASFGYMGSADTTSLNMNVELNSPFLTEKTLVQGSFYDLTNTGRSTGFLNNTTSFTDFTIAATTFTGGTIYVYGYGIGT
jgi:hypothetical protein